MTIDNARICASRGGERVYGAPPKLEAAPARVPPLSLGATASNVVELEPGLSAGSARPRALDLYCGAGGASMGLYRAGFDVSGIDIRRQPRYPFRFIQADALMPPVRLDDFDLIWASPPCQAFTLSNNRDRRGLHLDLVAKTRTMIAASRSMSIIENVPHAPIRADLVLDGTMFPDLKVIRRRHFELSFRAPFRLGFDAKQHVSAFGWSTPLRGSLSSHSRAARRRKGLPERDDLTVNQTAMGINWMTRDELGESIPPAYAEFIGREAIRQLRENASS